MSTASEERTSTMASRRSVIRAGAGAGVVSVLSACAGGGQAGGQQPNVTKQPVTIRWSTWGDESNPMVEGSAKGAAIFKEKFPNVTVKPESQVDTPGGATWYQKNFTEWISGTGPDVSGGCCNYLPDWGSQGILTNMDPLIKRDSKQVPLNDY